jgi:hypothetical protein
MVIPIKSGPFSFASFICGDREKKALFDRVEKGPGQNGFIQITKMKPWRKFFLVAFSYKKKRGVSMLEGLTY